MSNKIKSCTAVKRAFYNEENDKCGDREENKINEGILGDGAGIKGDKLIFLSAKPWMQISFVI